jgi:hypothetical protein
VQKFNDASSRSALKCHDRESDNLGIQFPNEASDSFPNFALHENEVRNSHLVVRVNIAGN